MIPNTRHTLTDANNVSNIEEAEDYYENGFRDDGMNEDSCSVQDDVVMSDENTESLSIKSTDKSYKNEQKDDHHDNNNYLTTENTSQVMQVETADNRS